MRRSVINYQGSKSNKNLHNEFSAMDPNENCNGAGVKEQDEREEDDDDGLLMVNDCETSAMMMPSSAGNQIHGAFDDSIGLSPRHPNNLFHDPRNQMLYQHPLGL